MTDRLEQANAALSSLNERRAALVARVTGALAQKTTLAHDALTGNTSARAKLEAANREIRAATSELEDFTVAIPVAEAEIAAAEESAAAQAQRERVRQALEFLGECRLRAKQLQEAFETFVSLAARIQEDRHTLRDAGAILPTHDLLRVNFGNAVQAGLMAANLHSEHIAPRYRHRLVDLLEAYLSAAERSLKAEASSAKKSLRERARKAA
jgi:hypothetical protein